MTQIPVVITVPTRLIANKPDSTVRVSWAELEAPDAPEPASDRKVHVSWAELEVPTPDSKVQVSFAEMETPDSGQTVWNFVDDFGGNGNDSFDNTSAFNSAFSTLEGSGDRLFVPQLAGGGLATYRHTGTIFPKSGMDIEFEVGTDTTEYESEYPGVKFPKALARTRMVSTADAAWAWENVSNVNVYNLRQRVDATPKSVRCNRIGTGVDNNDAKPCSNIYFENHVIEKTSSWCCRIAGVSHDLVWNGYKTRHAIETTDNIDDGMDFVECHDITLRNFEMHTNDDGPVVKSRGTQTFNILIEDGYVRTRGAALVFGSEIGSGNIDSVTMQNIYLKDCGAPIYFKFYNPNPSGGISNITIDNITSTDPAGRTQRFIHAHTYASDDSRAFKMTNVVVKNSTFTSPCTATDSGGNPFNELVRIDRQTFEIRDCSFTCSGATTPIGVLLRRTPDNTLNRVTGSGFTDLFMVDGSSTINNTFNCITEGQVDSRNGASTGAQIYTTVGCP